MTGESGAADRSFVVREADGPEHRACRMLLPEAEASLGWARLLVAADPGTGAVMGAAMALPMRHQGGDAHERFIMRVARPFRGRGIGTALLALLEAAARSAGTKALVATAADGDAAAFLGRSGFVLQERVLSWEIDVHASRARIAPIIDRVLRGAHVPAGVRIDPLTAEAIPRLAALHSELIGGVAHAVAARMREMLADPAWAHSRVLSVAGIPQALFAARPAGSSSSVPFHFVAPHLQAGRGGSGWATLLVFGEMLERARDARVERCEFDCLERNGPMMALAARFGARRTAAREMLFRPVA